VTGERREMSMTRNRTWSVLVLSIAIGVLSGCSIRLADFTAISTKNVHLDRVDLDTLPQTPSITGEDSALMILFFPLGFPHLENAVDDALQKGNGDILTDAVLYSRGWWFLIGQNTLQVKGTVVRTRGAGK
jgi:hypothetical protein